jgi:hypothetical protein
MHSGDCVLQLQLQLQWLARQSRATRKGARGSWGIAGGEAGGHAGGAAKHYRTALKPVLGAQHCQKPNAAPG